MSQLVSILIPCFNAARYVEAAIESVLAQTWKAIEVIVVDDGSTDGSDRVLLKYAARNVRVVTPQQPLRSAAKSRNLAYQHSKGEYIKFFDADDLMHPRMIERQVQRLEDSETDVASSGWGRFYRDDIASFKLNPQSVWRDIDARDWLVEAWMDARPMTQPGMFLIPRKLMQQTGGWDEKLTLIDDFEFFTRVLSHASKVRFTADVPLMYRSGLASSLSGQKSDTALESAFHSLLRGTAHLLSTRDDANAKRACANMLQDYVYTNYPRRRDLLKSMADRIQELGGSDLTPTGPPNFHRLRKVVGWKTARLVQRLLRR
jgi:GT2 family glycosyltransferase